MIGRTRPFAGALYLAGALLAASASAQAQDAYSETQLQSFASAVIAVNEVVERWRPQIVAAPDEEVARDLAQQANGEMRAAIDDVEGITVDEYQQIAQAAQADPALIARIEAIMTDLGVE